MVHPNGRVPGSHDTTMSTPLINGVPVYEFSRGASVGVGPDGQVVEHELHGHAMLGDGTVVENLRETRRCDLCTSEAQVLALNGTIAPVQAMLLGRYPANAVAASSMSGALLCQRHQRRIQLPDGSQLILTPAEATQLERQQRAKQFWRRIASLFVELDHG